MDTHAPDVTTRPAEVGYRHSGSHSGLNDATGVDSTRYRI